MKTERIALITSGYFPVPATLGGAVEALDENLVNQNEIEGNVEFVVFSCYEANAEKISQHYKNTTVKFIKTPCAIQILDKAIYYLAKNVLRKQKSLSYRYIAQRLFFLRKVAKDLRDNDYDKVMLENHSTLFLTLKFFDNYKKYKGRYYYHLHNVVTNDYGCLRIIAGCRKVLGVSDYINSTLKQFLGDGIPNPQYCVLRNKIDRSKFAISLSHDKKNIIREKFGLQNNDRVVLFTGRFSEEKGIKELLAAFKNIKDQNVKLLVVGSYYFGSGMHSSFEKEMKTLVEEMERRVIFTGFINYEEIPQVYAIADVVVIPSMWDDPAPLTVIESLTAGKALITTYSGGIPEYAEGASIILKRDENLIKNLTVSIIRVLQDPNLKKKLEEKAMRRSAEWSLESYYSNFIDKLDIGGIKQ